MAAEFFRNVDAALAGEAVKGADGRATDAGTAVDGSGGRREAPDGSGAPASTDLTGAPGAVYTRSAPAAPDAAVFVRGVVAGAAAALAGAVVGAWISRRAGRA
jgi:uncharacterized protein